MSDHRLLKQYLPYLLHRAQHLFSAEFHASLQKVGVQISEWRVLAVLADHGSSSVQEVANVALLPQPTASHACRRLENEGLISRIENDRDRRRKMLSLTDDGRELVEGLIEQAETMEAQTLERLSIDPKQLTEQLTRLIDELEALPNP